MPSIIDDILTIIFWTITYLFIVYAGFRSRSIKQVSMPYIAGILNIAWEICALFWISGFWGYILWLSIDFFIVYFSVRFLDSKIKKIAYIASIVFFTVFNFIIFDKFEKGFAYSVYIIDLIMAVCYLIDRKKLSPIFKIPIAITKLLGDFFAGFVFKHYTFTVVIAVIVFVCNVIYLFLCIKDKVTCQKTKHTG